MTEQQLLKLKEEIEQAKQNAAEYRGRLKSMLDTLATSWGCKSVKEAKAKVRQLDKEINSINAEIEKGLALLQERYEFD